MNCLNVRSSEHSSQSDVVPRDDVTVNQPIILVSKPRRKKVRRPDMLIRWCITPIAILKWFCAVS